MKIAKMDILQLLLKLLEDEDVRVKEAAGGILANLALTHSNHNAMVEAGIIPKLVRFLPILKVIWICYKVLCNARQHHMYVEVCY